MSLKCSFSLILNYFKVFRQVFYLPQQQKDYIYYAYSNRIKMHVNHQKTFSLSDYFRRYLFFNANRLILLP